MTIWLQERNICSESIKLRAQQAKGEREVKVAELIMLVGGDRKIQWAEDDPESLEKAKKTFVEKLKAGWLAFKILKGGKSKPITEFDSKADKIVITPPIAGG